MDKAELVVVNGNILTMNDARPRAEALAVRGGHIIALGSDAELRAYITADTRVIDLAGRMAMPGLIDGHCHASKGAIANLFSCKFEFSATPADICRALSNSASRFPSAAVILGGRWGSGFFERYGIGSPRAWLDDIVSNQAVYLRDDSGHNACANSRALSLIGISRHSIDPTGGRILREADGYEPNGLLLEEADSQARGRLPDWSAAQYQTGVREMVKIANAYGITGINDADANLPLLQAYHAVDAQHALSVYVAASLTTPYGHRTTPLDYAQLESWRDTYASRHVDTRFVKIYLDGVPTSARSACMLAPYVEHQDFPTGHRGVLHVDEATLAQDIAELETRGFTVKVHTAGDGAIRVALDAIEAAHKRSGRQDLRHELAHAGFVDVADIGRFAALNVVADLSPYLWYPAPIIDSIRAAVGPRTEQYWPIRDLLEAGAPLLAGSDWPAAVASMNPWPGIATLVTRRDPHDATRGALWPAQSISLAQALRVFTLDGARALRRSDITGSLEIGKSADLIVLDRDVFAVDPDAVASTEVDMTIFAGRLVYQRTLG